VERHQEPGRHYHTLDHVMAVLDQLEAVRGELEHPADAELAVWFHDAVYDPKRNDNESRSAELARQRVEEAGAPPAEVARITSMILDTRHQEAASSPDGAQVADADLAILAAPGEEFDQYEQAIRREYSHLTDAEFDQGRATFLAAVLRRPRIYQTARFAHLEPLARANLTRSLSRLSTLDS
jgi:predicted metal-dependent HD superfamily phosphohydrolase